MAVQDGFTDDTIEMWIRDSLVDRRSGVTTRQQIGLATSFQLDPGPLPAELEIVVPSRDLRSTVRLDFGGPRHLGISILQGRLAIRLQQEPFGYV